MRRKLMRRQSATATRGVDALITAILGLGLVFAFCALAWITFARP